MNLVDFRDIVVLCIEVWDVILNLEVLKICILGCKEFIGSVEDGFEVVVV